MNKIKIILAEDEVALGQIIQESLQSQNMDVDHYTDGASALIAYKNKKPDLLILDVMLPCLDGFQITKEIRSIDVFTPIILLTAKTQTKDVIEGFNYGCNDYIRKPFSIEELIVRIYALMDRISRKNNDDDTIIVGHYRFSANKQTLISDHKSYSLSHRESSLLNMLILQKNEVVNRTEILQKLWFNDDFFAGRSLDVFITKLRKKLASDESISIINVRGIGYKIIY